jgi:hypothetical protein
LVFEFPGFDPQERLRTHHRAVKISRALSVAAGLAYAFTETSVMRSPQNEKTHGNRKRMKHPLHQRWAGLRTIDRALQALRNEPLRIKPRVETGLVDDRSRNASQPAARAAGRAAKALRFGGQ